MRRVLLLLCLTPVYSNHVRTNTNQSEVFITYAGHVEAFQPVPERTTVKSQLIPERTTAAVTMTEQEESTVGVEESTTQAETTFEYPADDDEVLFIPHEREIERVEDEFYKTPMRISEIMEKKAVDDVLRKADAVSSTRTTEPPADPDILFISGKNAEKEEPGPKRRQNERHSETNFRRRGSEETIVQKKLDCGHLNCNNNLKAVCGGKKENGRYKYRLFLNECFFRKVNCAFTYPENRYKEVPKIRCDTVAIHLNARPTTTPTIPVPFMANMTKWKSYSSRRTMNQEANGRFCSHPCPQSCPEDYDPECAISKSGKKRVFVNHCKLDYDSCFYGEVWQRRPLSECVGGQKADMQHNRRFIAWMQRVGMVDKKGRLTL